MYLVLGILFVIIGIYLTTFILEILVDDIKYLYECIKEKRRRK